MSIKISGAIGRLADEPDLRFTPTGTAVVKFTLVTDTSRKKDGQWVNEDTSFWWCTAWKDLAVNIAESVGKGQRVFVSGSLKERKWTDKEGHERRSTELAVDDCGPSLRFNQAKVLKMERASHRTTPADDPWAV